MDVLKPMKGIKNRTKPHPFYERFRAETQQLMEMIYCNNIRIADKVCNGITDDYVRKNE